ncbi:MAG: AI-2E family transporter [Armatimonadetes bacterium]|nr:AI-2E family transporter [Armatimonadota bacterium]
MLKLQTEYARSWTPLILIATSIALLYFFWNVLVIFVLAALLAFVVAPFVGLLEKKLPKIFAILTVYLLIVIIIIVLTGLLAPVVSDQFQQFIDSIPHYLSRARDILNNLQERYFALPGQWRRLVDKGLTELQTAAIKLTSLTLPVVSALFGGFFALIFIPLLTFFMLLNANGYRRMILAITPRQHQESIDDLLTCAGQAFRSFLKGEIFLMLTVGLITGIGLYLVGMPYPAVFAVVAGLLEIVPTFGPVLTTIIVAIVAVLINPVLALKAAGVTILVQVVENVLLAPLVMAKAVGLEPVTVALSVLIGGSLAGIVGALVAIPLAVIIKIVLIYFYADESKLVAGDRAVCKKTNRVN